MSIVAFEGTAYSRLKNLRVRNFSRLCVENNEKAPDELFCNKCLLLLSSFLQVFFSLEIAVITSDEATSL